MEIFPQLLANSLYAGLFYALLALGFNLLYGTVKFFDMSYGAVAVAGAYVVFFFSDSSTISSGIGWPLLPSIVMGVAFSAALAYLLNALVYRPLRARKATGMVLLVSSLGVFTVIQAAIAMIFTSQFRALSQIPVASREFFGAILTDIQLIAMALSFAVFLALAFLLSKTSFGKSVRAVSDDTEVAKYVGINTERVISAVFLISGGIAGLAGIFALLDTGMEPTRGMALLLKGVIAVVVGGVGNIYGALPGGLLLGLVENFGIWKIAAEWKDAIAFALLIIFLLFRPQGILGKRQDKQ